MEEAERNVEAIYALEKQKSDPIEISAGRDTWNLNTELSELWAYGNCNRMLHVTTKDMFNQIDMDFRVPDYVAYELYCKMQELQSVFEPNDLGSISQGTVEVPPNQAVRYSFILQPMECGNGMNVTILETNMINSNHRCKTYMFPYDGDDWCEMQLYLYNNFANVPQEILLNYNTKYYYDHLDEFF